jgi:hypothetical protein
MDLVLGSKLGNWFSKWGVIIIYISFDLGPMRFGGKVMPHCHHFTFSYLGPGLYNKFFESNS